MNKPIALATNNKGKLAEYRAILAPMGFVIFSPADLNIESEPDETGANYRENSYIKAKALAAKVNMPVIADDSGLEVMALDGFPGLHSSRFASECGTYPKAYEELNRRLGDNPNRDARFVCCICYLETPESKPLYFEGICPGKLLKQAHGSNGFGFDPIFHSSEIDKDLGVAEEDEKNKISHRGKAIKKLEIYLAIQ